MKLSELAKESIGVVFGEDCSVNRVSTDTRKINSGDLFVAINGEHFDAHEFIETAKEKGARALVVEREVKTTLPYLLVEDSIKALGQVAALYRQRFAGKVVGITGSSGKTTVKGMLQNICKTAGACVATEGNLNNHIGVPLTLLKLVDQKDYAIVEAGTSGVGEIAYLSRLIQPEIALVTNVMPAHIEGFGSVEAIAKEKSDIYTESALTTAIVNLDDEHVNIMLSKISAKRIIGFSIDTAEKKIQDLGNNIESICPVSYHPDDVGCIHFNIVIGGEDTAIHLPVIGRHNLANALAAVAVAVALGISAEHIKQGLENFAGTNGRMQLVNAENGAIIINDTYNANPGSMKAAIDYLSTQTSSIFVAGDIGELGDASAELHQQVGLYAKEKKIQRVLSVGEMSANISQAFGERGEHFDDKEKLIKRLRSLVEEDSVMLVKGSRFTKMETVVDAFAKVEVN